MLVLVTLKGSFITVPVQYGHTWERL